MVEDYVLFTNHLGGKIGDSGRGRGVLPFHMGRTWFKLAVTSPNGSYQLLHMSSEQCGVACHITSDSQL